jgi:hypothetical protein
MNTIRNLFRNRIVLSSFQKQTHIIYQLSLSWHRLCTICDGNAIGYIKVLDTVSV